MCYKKGGHTPTHIYFTNSFSEDGWNRKPVTPHNGRKELLPALHTFCFSSGWKTGIRWLNPTAPVCPHPPPFFPLTPPTYRHTSCQSSVTILPNTCSTYILWNMVHWPTTACVVYLQEHRACSWSQLKFQHQLYLYERIFIVSFRADLCIYISPHLTAYLPKMMNS